MFIATKKKIILSLALSLARALSLSLSLFLSSISFLCYYNFFAPKFLSCLPLNILYPFSFLSLFILSCFSFFFFFISHVSLSILHLLFSWTLKEKPLRVRENALRPGTFLFCNYCWTDSGLFDFVPLCIIQGRFINFLLCFQVFQPWLPWRETTRGHGMIKL